MTVHGFVTELLQFINVLHLEIVELHVNREYLMDAQVGYQRAQKYLRDEALENTENAVSISYVKNKQFMTDIYRVKKNAKLNISVLCYPVQGGDRPPELSAHPLRGFG